MAGSVQDGAVLPAELIPIVMIEARVNGSDVPEVLPVGGVQAAVDGMTATGTEPWGSGLGSRSGGVAPVQRARGAEGLRHLGAQGPGA